jgi:hypothetical protein
MLHTTEMSENAQKYPQGKDLFRKFRYFLKFLAHQFFSLVHFQNFNVFYNLIFLGNRGSLRPSFLCKHRMLL